MSTESTPSPVTRSSSGGRLGSEYTEIEYSQFRGGSSLLRFVMSIIGILLWPIAIPLALLSRLSDLIFRSCSELLAMVPYFPGVILRYEFYRFSLRRCGGNVLVESGVVFVYRDIEVGSNVLIGRYSIIHHCDIGDDVLIGERCTFLSGSRQHRFTRTDVPMSQQGGERRRIRVEDDCWIGSHSVIMNDVLQGSIVAAAAVVRDEVAPRTIVGGVPARKIGERT
jgi:acetyltransferase-like isoleucine patch superfamily enzyme